METPTKDQLDEWKVKEVTKYVKRLITLEREILKETIVLGQDSEIRELDKSIGKAQGIAYVLDILENLGEPDGIESDQLPDFSETYGNRDENS